MGVERGKTSRSHSSQQVVGLRGSHVSPVFVTRDVLSFGSSAAQGHAMPCVVKLAIRGVIRCTLSEVYFTVMSAAGDIIHSPRGGVVTHHSHGTVCVWSRWFRTWKCLGREDGVCINKTEFVVFRIPNLQLQQYFMYFTDSTGVASETCRFRY